jgi:3-phosphoshikimate 1-carboxyvinyltransferase
MKVKISPSSLTKRVIEIPPSKSMAHRAIVCASLATGRSVITNIDYSVDIQTTLDGMKKLGAKIQQFDDYVIVDGVEDLTQINDTNIECNESGSTLRFFIPIFSLTNKEITFSGTKRLMERPQDIYEKIFNDQGLVFKQEDGKIIINGSLRKKRYQLKGNVSSQFKVVHT